MESPDEDAIHIIFVNIYMKRSGKINFTNAANITDTAAIELVKKVISNFISKMPTEVKDKVKGGVDKINNSKDNFFNCVQAFSTILYLLNIEILDGSITWAEPNLPILIGEKRYIADFNNTFLRYTSYDVLKIFRNHITYSYTIFALERSKWYSPYFALCQSSGTGKTRLILELARHMDQMPVPEYYVVYVCLRKETSAGYPPRSRKIGDFILSKAGINWSIFLYVLRLYIQDLDIVPTMTDLMLSETVQETFWTNFITLYDKHKNDKSLATSIRWKHPQIVLILDEGGILLEDAKIKFETLRTALIDCYTYYRVFCILLDTNSTISNFQPELQFDSSARAARPGANLLDPFYSFPISLPTSEQFQSIKSATDLKLNYHAANQSIVWNPMQMLLLSRPLFFAELESKIKSETQYSVNYLFSLVKKIDSLARWKLFHTSEDLNRADELHLISVAMIRYYIESTSTVRNNKLVRSHMAYCIHCSPDRSDIVVSYMSEPVLVNIAMRANHSDADFIHFIGWIAKQLMDRTLMLFNGGVGEIGEFIGQVVLLRANDKVLQDLSPGMSVALFQGLNISRDATSENMKISGEECLEEKTDRSLFS